MNQKKTAIKSPNKKKFSNKKVLMMINYNKYKIKEKRMKILAFKMMKLMKTQSIVKNSMREEIHYQKKLNNNLLWKLILKIQMINKKNLKIYPTKIFMNPFKINYLKKGYKIHHRLII